MGCDTVFCERTYSVLLVSSGEKFTELLRELLPCTDFYPVIAESSAGKARRLLLEKSFDLILVNAPLTDEFGTEFSLSLAQSTDAGILLFVKNELFGEVSGRVSPFGVLTLQKPAPKQAVLQAITLLCATRERMRRLEEKNQSLEEKMQEIRLVSRAKGLLMQTLSMPEDEAHRYLEKQAMDLRVSKRAVAENILRMYGK